MVLFSLKRILALLCLLYFLFPFNAIAEGTELKDVNISTVISHYSKKLDRTYVVDSSVKGKISIFLPRNSSDEVAEEVLHTALEVKGFQAIHVGKSVWKVIPIRQHRHYSFEPHDSHTDFSKPIILSSLEIEKESSNMPMLLTQARAVPYFKDGRSIGLRLFAIKKNSFYDSLRLRNGDILVDLDGEQLSEPFQLAELPKIALTKKKFTLKVHRNRQPISLKYEVNEG